MSMQWNLLFYVQKKQSQEQGLKKISKSFFIHKFFVRKPFNEIEQDAKETLIAVEQGDTLRMMLSVFVNLRAIHQLM